MSRDDQTFFGKTKRFARWSVILAASDALLLAVGVSTVRETYQDWKVDKEMKDLQGQVEQLEGKKQHIADMINTLNSADHIDLEVADTAVDQSKSREFYSQGLLSYSKGDLKAAAAAWASALKFNGQNQAARNAYNRVMMEMGGNR